MLLFALTCRADQTGRVRNVNYNNQLRASHATLAVGRVKPLYRALALFESMLMDPQYCIHYKMRNGKMAEPLRYLMLYMYVYHIHYMYTQLSFLGY